MGLFKKRAQQEIRAETGDEMEIGSKLLLALLGRDNVTKEMALELPALAAGISLIADKVASCPIRLYRELDPGVEEIKQDRRLYLLNHDTGDTMTSSQFWRAIIEDYYLGKGGFAYINKAGVEFKSLHYVSEDQVSIQANANPIFKNYMILAGDGIYYPFEFFKIMRKTKTGGKSKPITEESKLQIAVAYNTLAFENALVKKGGNKKGFLKSQHRMTQQAMDALKDAFRQLYANNDEAVVVLNEGIDFKESSNTSVEMQLNENKITNDGELAKLLHIPAKILEGNGTEEDFYIFIKNAVMPLINEIEASLDRDMLTEEEKAAGYYYAFDTRELTRGSMKERYAAYEIGLRNNFLQIDEIRDKEDLEPLGIDWITLGLDKVLYNPKTKEVYTPNTNQSVKMDDLKRGGEKIESGNQS